jgi:hypothetical protein
MKTRTKLALTSVLGLGVCAGSMFAQDTNSPPAGPGPGFRHPPPLIVAALDTNHDGIIDSNEIANASAALLTLDKNGDGILTPDEFMGPRPPGPGGLGLPKEILDKYDVNKDGKLDDTERAALEKDIADGKLPAPPAALPGVPGPGRRPPLSAQEILARFDADKDGKLDETELANFLKEMRPPPPHGPPPGSVGAPPPDGGQQ